VTIFVGNPPFSWHTGDTILPRSLAMWWDPVPRSGCGCSWKWPHVPSAWRTYKSVSSQLSCLTAYLAVRRLYILAVQLLDQRPPSVWVLRNIPYEINFLVMHQDLRLFDHRRAYPTLPTLLPYRNPHTEARRHVEGHSLQHYQSKWKKWTWPCWL
jgi:hypothetical protein